MTAVVSFFVYDYGSAVDASAGILQDFSREKDGI